jgi:hypothetical protein
MERGEEILYKSFELDPLAKMSVEIGKKNTKRVLNTLEYLGSLTIGRDASWLGIEKKITPLDPETALFVRDHSVFSNVRRTIDHGVAHQYGQTLLAGHSASESLIGAASAIALVERDENDNIQIYRKKQMGLENKHARDLVPDFHGVSSKSIDKYKAKESNRIEQEEQYEMENPPWEEDDSETQMMMDYLKRDKTPELKQEAETPPLKSDVNEVEEEDEEYNPEWED